MKILIATDAYFPQVNGVVRTLHETGQVLREQGHLVEYITPDLFLTFPMPKYNEIRLSINVWPRVGNLIEKIKLKEKVVMEKLILLSYGLII